MLNLFTCGIASSCFFLFVLQVHALHGQSSQVIVHEGTNLASAVSHDGKMIALDIQGTIGVVPVEGGKVKLLTDGMGDERQPSWSPEGVIAFQSYRDGNYHVWSVKPDGTELKQLTFGMYDDREPQFSRDGSKIIFSSDRSGNYDIWQLTLASGELKQLTTDPANDFHPAYSYDGKQFAYVSASDNAGLYIENFENGEETKLFLKGVNAPSWSPDGKRISFNNFQMAKSVLMTYTISTKKLETLSVNNEDVFPFRTSWLSDNELIYTGDGKIRRLVVDKKSLKDIPFTVEFTVVKPSYKKRARDFDTEATHKVQGIFGPVVSPDGNSVAFTALGDIWLLKKGTSKPTQISNDSYLDIDPAWSYDGKMLTYVSDRTNGTMNIWIRDMQSGIEKKLTNLERHCLQPAFSPDGKKIAFLLNDGVLGFGTATLNVLDIASGEMKPLHKPLFTPGKPTWSSDGKTIALSALLPYSSRFREGVTKVLFVPVNGDAVKFFSPVEARAIGQRGKNGPVWSPDGSKLAYIQDGVLWISSVNPVGDQIHAPVRLTNEMSEAPSWSGDSKSIVYIATDKLKKVYLNDGQTEEIPLSLEWKNEKNNDQVVIHAGQLWDGKTNSYKTNMDVILNGNRIKQIIPHRDHGSLTVVDASKNVVMPGLIEMHTHQNGSAGETLGRIWLSYGITSVRETGGDPYDALERKESWASGARVGPREFFTGPLLEGGRVYYELASSVSTPLHLDMELKRADDLQYDFVKTYVRMPDYFQKRATEFAHEHGMPVSSHEIYPATSYGVDMVEHISATSRRGYSPKLTAMNRNYEDVIQILAKSGMNMTPTVSLFGGFYINWQRDLDIRNNRQLNALFSKKYVSDISAFTKLIIKESSEAGDKFVEMEKSLKNLHQAGVKITAGTDSPFTTYGLSLHVELQNFVEAGFTPFEALRAATVLSSEALGAEKDLGSLEEGKLADISIVNGDPLKNIKDAWKVEVVFKNGIKYTIQELLKEK